MSINNHFSSDIPQTPWWTQHHPLLMENSSTKSPISNPQSLNYNSNWSYETPNLTEILKQPMFEKPLTPSDVGKLNRLVIPKQYAEKYFPLGAVSADSGEKGLMLSFEDESGKSWRFRYSYWSSSQSYVLTKGWSRFVKEKRLDAGDIVLFERHPADCERLFIGWRRRAAAPAQHIAHAQPDGNCSGGSGGWGQVLYNAHPYPSHPHVPPITYQAEYLHAGSVVPNQRNGNGNSSKRQVRLFGVNLECEPDESESEPIASDGSSFSSDGPPHYQYYTNHHNHVDMNLAGDVNQMRYQYRG